MIFGRNVLDDRNAILVEMATPFVETLIGIHDGIVFNRGETMIDKGCTMTDTLKGLKVIRLPEERPLLLSLGRAQNVAMLL